MTDNIGIVADVSTDAGDDDGRDSHKYGELGAGYFTRLGENIRAEAFGGVGYGKSTGIVEIEVNGEPIPDIIDSGSYYRAFGQFDVGKAGKVLDIGFSARLAYVRYRYSERTNGGPDVGSDLFLEPVFFMRVGYKWVKFGLQAGLTYPLMQGYASVGSFPLHLTMGVHTKFNGFE